MSKELNVQCQNCDKGSSQEMSEEQSSVCSPSVVQISSLFFLPLLTATEPLPLQECVKSEWLTIIWSSVKNQIFAQYTAVDSIPNQPPMTTTDEETVEVYFNCNTPLQCTHTSIVSLDTCNTLVSTQGNFYYISFFFIVHSPCEDRSWWAHMLQWWGLYETRFTSRNVALCATECRN